MRRLVVAAALVASGAVAAIAEEPTMPDLVPPSDPRIADDPGLVAASPAGSAGL
jgi:hypothetical protein